MQNWLSVFGVLCAACPAGMRPLDPVVHFLDRFSIARHRVVALLADCEGSQQIAFLAAAQHLAPIIARALHHCQNACTKKCVTRKALSIPLTPS